MPKDSTTAVFAASLIIPYPAALLMAVTGGNRRGLKAAVCAYAGLAAALNLALLHGFLSSGGTAGWGPLELTRLRFPVFMLINLVSAACALYSAFSGEERKGSGLVTATVPVAAGVSGLAVLSDSLVAFTLLWVGVSAAALTGLLAQGVTGRRLRAFLPWLASDGLLILGVVLAGVLLHENAVLIEPPLASGSETQVVLIMVLFLVSTLMRLGVFPLGFWVGDLAREAGPSWSAFYLGAANPLLCGFRLLVVSAMIARLVAADWGLALVLVGLASALAGPLVAATAEEVQGYLAGMYSLQAGCLVVGVGLFSRSGSQAAIFNLLVCPLFMSAAFMAAGTFEEVGGSRRLFHRRLSPGIAPAALAVLLSSGLSLAGLPPADGFAGKAMLSLSCLDKSWAYPYYAPVAAFLLAALSVAAFSVVRVASGTFSGRGVRNLPGRPDPVAALASIALCAASLLIGVFPGILMRNFVERAALELFPSGFTGPGVVYRATGVAAESALKGYSAWSETVAAFILAVAASALVLYFAGRRRSNGAVPVLDSRTSDNGS